MIPQIYSYQHSLITNIMFVETKNTNYKFTEKGVVFNDGRAYYYGGIIKFNDVDYEITSVPEVDGLGSKSWVKVTFSVKKDK